MKDENAAPQEGAEGEKKVQILRVCFMPTIFINMFSICDALSCACAGGNKDNIREILHI